MAHTVLPEQLSGPTMMWLCWLATCDHCTSEVTVLGNSVSGGDSCGMTFMQCPQLTHVSSNSGMWAGRLMLCLACGGPPPVAAVHQAGLRVGVKLGVLHRLWRDHVGRVIIRAML